MTTRSIPADEWILPILGDLVSSEKVAQATDAIGDDASIWSAAIRLNLASEDDLLAAVSRRSRVSIAGSLEVSPEAKKVLPERIARKYHVLPLSADTSSIEIATANPYDIDCERTIAFMCGRTVRMSLASPIVIAERMAEVYDGVRRTRRSSDRGFDTIDGETVIKLVDRVVAAGIDARASDIHLEPEENGIAVRHRIDGLLRRVTLLPKAVGIPLVSRIKIMAKLDIADRLRPQGGHASVGIGGARVDLRVSTLPASHGEKVVIRILDQRAAIQSL
ncbi:MAG: ATPase, T2SS/T4P/T4SS family, partial [Gemmatimonadales bacterium]